MIEVYTSPSCSSCRKAKKWLDDYGIKYIEKNLFVVKITREDIKQILEKTENGFEDIISTRSKAFKENNLNVDDMTINELLDFIVANPSVLRRPIIVDKHFLPRELRNVIYCNNCDNCNCSYVNALERALSDDFIEKTQK